MMFRTLAVLAASTVCLTVAFAQELTSGLAVGRGPTPFHPLNITGEFAGQKSCIVCEYGGDPVAAVFARKDSDALTSLIKQLDAAGSKGIKSFVVYLTDEENRPAQIKTFAEKNGVKNTVLAIDNVTGPKAWTIAKEAEVTVVLYNRRRVEANHAFAAGKLDTKGVDAIVSDLPKLLVASKDSDK